MLYNQSYREKRFILYMGIMFAGQFPVNIHHFQVKDCEISFFKTGYNFTDKLPFTESGFNITSVLSIPTPLLIEWNKI